ncbi:hypothetical protein [Pedobacter arcticus]|uniref:hypothetical protein n=1 Tax=Pedobacter arcticus TaxID=752140 RepID=UPI0012B5CBD9|nr:hypothetical protein [Pedobacter arcticus]
MFKIIRDTWRGLKDEKRLRVILYLFLFTTLSGAIRKWGVDSKLLSNALLGIQLIIPLCFLFFKNAFHFDYKQRNIFVILLTYIFILLLLAANPLGATLGHGILGIIVHLGFWLPMFIYVKDPEAFKLEKLIPLLIILCFAQVILGSIQSTLPTDAWLNRYAVTEGDGFADALVGDSVRVSGTFSYISGYGSFMLFYTLLVCVLIKIRYQPFILIPFILIGYYGCLISGSRGTVYSYLIIIGMYVVTSVNIKANSKLIGGALLVILVGGFFNFILQDPLNIYEKFAKSSDNFEERTEGAGDNTKGRVTGAVDELLYLNFEHDIIGVGLGSTYQGANALFGYNPNLKGQGFETEFKRVVLEGGYILLILRFIMFFYLMRFLKGSFFFKLTIIALSLFVFSIIYNTYNAFFFMLGIALIDRVSRLESTKDL